MVTQVHFESQGSVLRGRLFAPDAGDPVPGVVMAPGFSATSHFPFFERYAAAIAGIGVAALLFDFRGFGRSDGEPRGEIDAWSQARDYRAAIDHLRGMDRILPDRVGIWGVSAGAAVSSVVAAADPTLAAVVLLVPGFGGAPSPPDPDGARFERIRHTLLTADLDALDRAIDGPLAVVSRDQDADPSFLTSDTAFRWFTTNGGREGTEWVNRVTLSRLVETAFDAQVCVPHIAAPILMAIAREDPESDADVARGVFATAGEPKRLLTVDGGHFGALTPDTPEFHLTAATTCDFLRRHLLS